MDRIAAFEKVSLYEYTKTYRALNGSRSSAEQILSVWESIRLPSRATKGSAGYDFFLPYDITLKPNEWLVIPTGIRCQMDEGWVLMCLPKSGLGFKYRTKLANGCGVVDCDFYHSDSEGHILLKMSSEQTVALHTRDAYAQGIFVHFGITRDDQADGIRNGGFGSTAGKGA